jgi:hypothetical protein
MVAFGQSGLAIQNHHGPLSVKPFIDIKIHQRWFQFRFNMPVACFGEFWHQYVDQSERFFTKNSFF